MTEKAKFKYSASKGTIELEGSEEFVTKHFEGLTDIVRVISRHSVIETKPDITIAAEHKPIQSTGGGAEQQSESLQSYPDFFSEINGKLKIVTQIEGKSKKATMLNAALLYCYGSELLGDDQVGDKDIRQACEEHGILDAPNFATIFSDKTLFLSDGVKGGSKEIKLTYQGKQKAKELLGNVESAD